MKKILSLIMLLSSIGVLAQTNTLAISVATPMGIENENTQEILKNTLAQAITLNGYSATESRFVILPKITPLSKNTTASVPAKYIIELEAYFFLVDTYSKQIMSQCSFNLKGIAGNEDKAYIKAIRQINSRNSNIKRMLESGKQKIYDYFNSNSETIIKRIEAHINRQDYTAAIIEIYSIPMVCSELYNQVSELLSIIPTEKNIRPSYEESVKYYKASRDIEEIMNQITTK